MATFPTAGESSGFFKTGGRKRDCASCQDCRLPPDQGLLPSLGPCWGPGTPRCAAQQPGIEATVVRLHVTPGSEQGTASNPTRRLLSAHLMDEEAEAQRSQGQPAPRRGVWSRRWTQPAPRCSACGDRCPVQDRGLDQSSPETAPWVMAGVPGRSHWLPQVCGNVTTCRWPVTSPGELRAG